MQIVLSDQPPFQPEISISALSRYLKVYAIVRITVPLRRSSDKCPICHCTDHCPIRRILDHSALRHSPAHCLLRRILDHSALRHSPAHCPLRRFLDHSTLRHSQDHHVLNILA